MSPSLLSIEGLSKAFPGVKALDAVSLSLRAGEIHALMGENGAGKSTLIKVLTGLYPADTGKVVLAGREIAPGSPREAEAAGISTVYQEVNLIPTLSVGENILLGRQPRRFGLIHWRELTRRATVALARVELRLDPAQPLGELPVALQQMVAIARALDLQARVLILDEPTSSLDEAEVKTLFGVLRRLRGEGLGIIFVSHFLDQIYALTDCITVLRNGASVGTYDTAELPRLSLVGKMLGKEITALPDHGQATNTNHSRPWLEARNLSRSGSIDGLNFGVRPGEVIGLAGLLGSGRSETMRLFFGADRATGGELRIDGEAQPFRKPQQAIAAGFGFCAEDRKADGILPNLSVRENLVLAMQASRGAFRQLSVAHQLELANHYIQTLGIKTPSSETPIRSLSGGNQQKVLLARWLVMRPRLLLLDEPTRGIDVGAKAEIEMLITKLCAEGMSVLFVATDIEEVERISHRVVVLREGRQIAELKGREATEQRIMELIAQ